MWASEVWVWITSRSGLLEDIGWEEPGKLSWRRLEQAMSMIRSCWRACLYHEGNGELLKNLKCRCDVNWLEYYKDENNGALDQGLLFQVADASLRKVSRASDQDFLSSPQETATGEQGLAKNFRFLESWADECPGRTWQGAKIGPITAWPGSQWH